MIFTAAKKSRFFVFWAKALVFFMLLQGIPLQQIGQAYEVRFDIERYRPIIDFFSPSEAEAAAPVADSGADQFLYKNLPVERNAVLLDGAVSFDPDGDALTYYWFGPFPSIGGESPSVTIPEGTYTVSLRVGDGNSISDPDTSVIAIDPCFEVSARAKSGKVQLTWTNQQGAERYDIYRADTSDPYSFVKIAETDSTYSTYLDTSVENEVTYLYAVGALSEGSWCYSNVVASHPTSLRTRTPVNYEPVIYSRPITLGYANIVYNYDVNAADPNGGSLTYSLASSPSGMSIDSSTGLITWMPEDCGPYDVTVEVTDGEASDTQVFTVDVTDIDSDGDGIPDCMELDMDLEPASIDVTGVVVDPQTLQMSGTVEVEIGNNGTDAIPTAYELVLFEDTDMNQVFDLNTDQALGAVTITDGPSGGTSFAVSVDIEGNALFAGNLIYAFVDGGNQVDETDEDNNIIHSMASCEYIPPVGTFDPVLEWAWTSSNVLSNSLNVMMTPAVIDVNGDDIPDIVFGSTSSTGGGYVETGVLRVISGDSGTEIFSITDSSLAINTAASIAAGDIDQDGLPEIIACDATGARLIAFEHDGTFKWRSPYLEAIYWGAVALADLDSDGFVEIIAGRQVLNSDGTIRWSGTGGRGSDGTGPLSFALDVNNDGSLEVMAGNTAYTAAGDILWQTSSLPDGSNAAGDFDDDPFPEIVLVSSGQVWLLENDGTVKWGPVAIPGGGTGGPPTVADFDNDGNVEIGVAGASRYCVLDTDGTILWQSVTQDRSSNRTGSSVFDFDGDGSSEVVYRDELKLRIYRGSDGYILFETPMSSCTWHEYVLVADVDNDGNAELVAVANNNCGYGPQRGVYVFGDANDSWINTRKIWNQHAYSITNVNDDGTIPQYQANNWDIFNNFRQNQMLNPFGCIDLTASYLRVNSSNCPDSVEILARIGNGGALHTPPGLKAAIYDGDPVSGGILRGTAYIADRLDPGEYAEVAFTLENDISGTHTIYVVADDDGAGNGMVSEIDENNNKAWATFNLCMNPPVFTSSPLTEATKGEAYIYDADATDPDAGDILTFSLTVFPSNMTIGSTDGLIEWTPDGSQIGENPVTVRVEDAGGLFATQSFVISVVPVMVLVPDVAGQAQADAEVEILVAGLTVGAVSSAHSAVVPVGHVIGQDPDAGTSVAEGTAVNLVVSAGPVMVLVPDVAGQTQADAEAAILAAGLTVGAVSSANSAVVPAGHVIGQEPDAGTSVAEGTAVNLVVSAGPVMVLVPDVAGQTQADAEAAILVASLTVGAVSSANSTVVPAGHVISQDPAAGTSAVEGTAVNLVISVGPEMVIVPDVAGQAQADAEAAIVTAGLAVGAVSSANSAAVPVGCVISQTPAPGAAVSEGTAVNLVISLGPVMVLVPDVAGLAQADAEAEILAASLTVGAVSSANSDVVPVGNVISQDPAAWTSVAEGTAVNLVISTGSAMVLVPDVVGLVQADAESAIIAAGLVTGTVGTGNSGTVPAGSVISQSPDAGTSVNPGSSVDLVVSLGPAAAVDITLPKVTVVADPVLVNVGSAVLLAVTAVDDQGVIDLRLTVDGEAVSLDAAGQATFIPTESGLFTAVGEAEDAAGNVGNATAFFSARAASDNGAPTAAITSPGDGVLIGAETDIVGTASDADLTVYKLQAAPAGSGDFVTFGEGFSSVVSGTLGEIDPGNFNPGFYDIRVCAEDTWGNATCSASERYELAAVAPMAGIVRYAFLDGQVDAVGIPITIRRIYDSRNKVAGDFGVGWRLETQELTLSASRIMGEAWNGVRSGGWLPTYSIQESADHKVSVTLPDGSIHRFYMRPDPQSQQVYPIAWLNGADFIAYPGTTSTLTPNEEPAYASGGYPGSLVLYDSSLVEIYNPTAYTLNLEDGRKLTFNQSGGELSYALGKIQDASGNAVTISNSGISHTSGASVSFTRDGAGRITAVTHPDGRQRTYTYDAAGDLVASTDYEGSLTEYRYDDDHNLIQIVDARGNIPGTLIYDEEGRIVGLIDSDGNRVQVGHDDSANQEIVTDRLGNTTIITYDDRGNRTAVTDPLGNTKTYTYDANNYLLTVTDPLGNVETFTRDAKGNVLSYTDPEGKTWSSTYDAAGRVLSNTDPLGRIWQYTYDAQGNVETVQTPRGGSFAYDYHASGGLASVTDPLSNVTQFHRDASGKFTGYTDPLGVHADITRADDGQLTSEEFTVDGNTVRYEYGYDRNGSLTDMTLPDGSTSSVSYSPTGFPVSATLASGSTQSIAYDKGEQFVSFTEADGRVHQFERDAEGQVTGVIKPGGRRIDLTLDPLGRPTSMNMPNGLELNNQYDAAGRIVSQQRFGQGATTYEYDKAGRVVKSTAPDGGVTTYEYDDAGQLAAFVNPLLERTEFTYDAAGNLTRTLLPDGNELGAEYDLLDRITRVVDEDGRQTDFSYDAGGRLDSVTNGLGETTSYTHDEMGNLTGATTDGGNQWSFTYDLLGRNLSRTFPWGGTENYVRNAAGAMTSVTDAAGQTVDFEYDAVGRIAKATFPDGEVQTRSYNSAGDIASFSDSSGVTQFVYNASGMLDRVDYPDGSFIEYDYDVSKRVGTIRTAGGETQYVYDAVGRLTQIDDSELGAASYTYDAAGRIAQVDMPDGSTSLYTRNGRGWVTRILTTDSAGTVIRDQSYTHDGNGNPLSVTSPGRQVDYVYDAAGRVVSETIAGPDAQDLDYLYDEAWNLTRMGGRDLSYDGTMRLSDDGVFNIYTYDDAGRPATRSDGSVSETFTYDGFGRLVRLDRTGALPARVDLQYNDAGLLRRIVSDGVGRNLLWDATQDVPVLLEERDDSGTLLRRYVYGLGPVGISEGGATKVLHQDMLGSIRLVTSDSGAVLGENAYTAYGGQTLGTGSGLSTLGFAGEYFVEELGFYYLRSRFYDPTAGRFLTPDLEEPRERAPQSFNPYLYAGANPVRFTDPNGTFSLVSVSIAMSVVNILVSIALPAFPSPILLVARAFGWYEGEVQLDAVGLSFAFALSKGNLAGGFQIDILGGPNKWLAVFYIFAGGQIGSAYGDSRLAQPQFTFWAGTILGLANEDPSSPRGGAYILFSGTYARVLSDLALRQGRGAARRNVANLPVRTDWSRWAAAIQWELGGITNEGDLGTSFHTAFTVYGSYWGNAQSELIKLKKQASGPRRLFDAGIALTVYLPIIWLVWDGRTIEADNWFGL